MKRTLESYGSLEALEQKEPEAFERLSIEAKQGLLGISESKRQERSFDLSKTLSSDRKAYGWKLFESIFDLIQIKQALIDTFEDSEAVKTNLEILKLLTYQRVFNPGSKIYTHQRQQELFGKWKVDENKCIVH